MQSARNDRSLGELFGDLAGQTSTLVRSEIAIAKAEMIEAAKQAGRGAATIAIGGALAYAGLLAVVSAFVLLLANIMPVWVAALIVGLIVIGVGAMAISRGRAALSQAQLAPRQTLATLANDVDLVKGERG
jgi:hypothetical protein